jgi:hypothetical protein
MIVTLKVEKEYNVTTLLVSAKRLYPEDATVNGVEDEAGDLMPCMDGDQWKPIINFDTGQITNWTKGTVADVHYTVCDAGSYTLVDADGNNVLTHEGYVPECLSPKEEGYGDYIIMDIDADGFIQDWEPTLDGLLPDED